MIAYQLEQRSHYSLSLGSVRVPPFRSQNLVRCQRLQNIFPGARCHPCTITSTMSHVLPALSSVCIPFLCSRHWRSHSLPSLLFELPLAASPVQSSITSPMPHKPLPTPSVSVNIHLGSWLLSSRCSCCLILPLSWILILKR